jgi:hypothetical protein
MTDLPLIAAVKTSNREQVVALLDSGHDIHERGEQDWPALNFAAGKGDLEMVRLLSDRGADVFATGADQRTPYQIAIAASHAEVARELAQCEMKAGGDHGHISSQEWETRLYCKAYRLDEVRCFAQWKDISAPEIVEAASDDDLVFIHEDYSVTRSIWRDKEIVFKGDNAEWRQFCEATLRFHVPRDLDEVTQEIGDFKVEADQNPAEGNSSGR